MSESRVHEGPETGAAAPKSAETSLNLLFCCPDLPYPLDSGLKVRVFNLGRELARRHQVHLACLSRSTPDLAALAAIEAAGMSVTLIGKPALSLKNKLLTYAGRLAAGVPLPYILSWEESIFTELSRLAASRPFDMAIAEHLFMARFVLGLNPRKVITEHNIEGQLESQLAAAAPLPRRLLKQAEAAWIATYERKLLRSFAGVIAVSEADRRALARMAPDVPIALVGNGVDCGRFRDLFSAPGPAEARLLFLGLMSYEPNAEAVLWFINEIFPRIRSGFPKAAITIAGAEPAGPVRALDNGESIRVTGAVTDVLPYYQQNSVMVVPLRQGGGSRLKILEAFAAGMPVVSTSKGAEGLEVENGIHLLIADRPASFAAAVGRLLADRELCTALRRNARRLVEDRYDWPILAAELEGVLIRLKQGSQA